MKKGIGEMNERKTKNDREKLKKRKITRKCREKEGNVRLELQ